MRLTILDRGHRLRTKGLLAPVRLVSRQPVVDAVKLALYRRESYGGGHLNHRRCADHQPGRSAIAS
jgi:hypothetical protein